LFKKLNPLTILFALLIFMLIMSNWFLSLHNHYQKEIEILEEYIDHESKQIQHIISSRIEPIEISLVNQWTSTKNTTDEITFEFYLETVPIYYSLFPGYLAINYINTSNIIQWVYPFEINQAAMNKSTEFTADGNVNEAFQNTRTTLETNITPVTLLFQGAFGIAVYIPIINEVNNELLGFFNVVLELDTLFKIALNLESPLSDNYIMIKENNTLLFHNHKIFDEKGSFTRVKTINVYNLEWKIYGRLSQERVNFINPLYTIYMPIIAILSSLAIIYISILTDRENQAKLNLIEEREEREELIQRIEKMNSLGILSGGIAHEFNNLLMGIQGNVSLLKILLERNDPEKSKRIISSIEQIISQSKDLTNQILVFSRQSNFESEVIDFDDVVNDTLKIFEQTIDRRTKIDISYKHMNSIVEANKSYLSHCLLNLLNNAIDSIDSVGTIKIVTSNKKYSQLDKSSIYLEPSNVESEYFSIKTIDTGSGISSENMKLLFTPFFTTKDIGKGTGLGLHLIYKYISSIGGGIIVKSEFNKGSTFELLIPIVNQKNDTINELALIHNSDNNAVSKYFEKYGSAPRILLVDDEVSILNSLSSLLKSKSLSVTAIKDGLAALDYVKSHQFEIMVVDINLPIINGIELALKILEMNGDQKIIFISGYHGLDIIPKELTNHKLIQKPFDVDTLLNKIYEILYDYMI
jgi:signal transduction histidine kinase